MDGWIMLQSMGHHQWHKTPPLQPFGDQQPEAQATTIDKVTIEDRPKLTQTSSCLECTCLSLPSAAPHSHALQLLWGGS